MKKVTVINAFSLNMIGEDQFPINSMFEVLSVEEVKSLLIESFESAVGHADTAVLFTNLLGVKIPMTRSTLSLKKGDVMVFGQYRGPRLPEGVSILPEGARIQWIKMTM